MCMHVKHAHTHKSYADLVLNNSTTAPREYSVHSVCLGEHGAKCQRKAS
jgi:hypothetical protein